MTLMKALGGLAVLVVGLVSIWALAAAIGAWRWQGATAALTERLQGAHTPLVAGRIDRVDFRELDTLPAPVQRFFRTVLTDGQPIVQQVQIEHTGTFNMATDGEQWRPFSSRQWVQTQRAGFVWDGNVSMMPGVPVRVHDAYVAGVGLLRPAVLGLVELTRLEGTPEVAQGELMRWLAETAWYPTALLPSQGMQWTALDDRSADATFIDGPVSVRLRFRFAAEGWVESVRAEARGRTVGKATVMTPWEGRWDGYERHAGMMVPMRGEVAWITPQGRLPYWRGTVTRLEFGFEG